jgi:hypothetical protein
MTFKKESRFRTLLAVISCVIVCHFGAASSAEEDNCEIIEITDAFYNFKAPLIIDSLDNKAVVLKLNNNGGNYFRSMILANNVREAEIPVIIEQDAKCNNDCSAVFLASPLRHSNKNIFFPRYSISEKAVIASLKPNEFYPVIEQRSALLFLIRGLSKPLQNKIFTSHRDPRYSLYPAMNTPELKWLSTSALDKETCNEIVSMKLAPTVAPNKVPDQ